MKKEIRIYSLEGKKQYQDERRFWRSQTVEFKIHCLERIRKEAGKIKPELRIDGNFARLRRVLRVVKQK